MKLSTASRNKLRDVHPDLIRVVERAIQITPIDFKITCGLRSWAEQDRLFAAGATRTRNSRHLTGHAVDFAAIVGGKVRWDWPLYGRIAEAFKKAAAELGIAIVWGGDWRTFKDGPHIELDRKQYP